MKIDVTNVKQGKNYLASTKETVIKSVFVEKINNTLTIMVLLKDNRTKFVQSGVDGIGTYADHIIELEFKRGMLHSVVKLTSESDEERQLMDGEVVLWSSLVNMYWFKVVPQSKGAGVLIAEWHCE